MSQIPRSKNGKLQIKTLFNFPRIYKKTLANKGGINKEAKATRTAHRRSVFSDKIFVP